MTHLSLSLERKVIFKLSNIVFRQNKRHFITSPFLSVTVSSSHNSTLENEMSAAPSTVLLQTNHNSQFEPRMVASHPNVSGAQSALSTSLSSTSSFQIHNAMATESLKKSKQVTSESDSDPLNFALNNVGPNTVQRLYYFDTLAFTKKLESKGFSREQAEGSVECLLEVIGNTLDHQAKHMITKIEQKIVEQQLHTEIMSVKKDMVLLQKSEFSALRTETEKISSDMARIQSHFQDEIIKVKGQFSLDINLERGRAVEAHASNEKSLQMLDNKIEMEIAHLKTTNEVYRNDIFKYAAGTVLTCTTLIIGFMRIWM